MPDVVVSNPGGVRVGRLDSLTGVRRELRRIYFEARTGTLETSEATKLCFILMSIARLLESSDVELRLEQLEKMMSGLDRDRYVQ